MIPISSTYTDKPQLSERSIIIIIIIIVAEIKVMLTIITCNVNRSI